MTKKRKRYPSVQVNFDQFAEKRYYWSAGGWINHRSSETFVIGGQTIIGFKYYQPDDPLKWLAVSSYGEAINHNYGDNVRLEWAISTISSDPKKKFKLPWQVIEKVLSHSLLSLLSKERID